MRNLSALLFQGRTAGDAELPARPLPAAVPQLALALLVLAIGLGAAIEWPWVLAVAFLLVLVGLLQAARAALELGRRRRTADEWLLSGAAPRPSSALLSWRAGELASPRLRAVLAQSLRRIEREVQGGTLPGAVPLNARAIRCHLGLVHRLHDRLEDEAQPVSVRGMLLVDRLLTEPGSPLYSRVPEDMLAEAIGDALAALDPAPAALAA